MQSTPNLDQFIPEPLTKLAYQGFQEGKKIFSFVHKSVSDRLINTIKIRSCQNKQLEVNPFSY
ncbi:MAG: hypothetical protein WBM44_04340 [Waterburya sp.]